GSQSRSAGIAVCGTGVPHVRKKGLWRGLQCGGERVQKPFGPDGLVCCSAAGSGSDFGAGSYGTAAGRIKRPQHAARVYFSGHGGRATPTSGAAGGFTEVLL